MNKNLVRGALLVAVTIVLQALRLFLPLPLVVSTFLIGTSVNMMLLLSLRLTGLKTALLLACLLPCTAYLQGQLLLPMLLPVVLLGNVVFIILAGYLSCKWLRLLLPPAAKSICMCIAAWLGLQFLGLGEAKFASGILYAMSVPQFVTAVLGTLAAEKMQIILQKKI